MAEPTVLVAGKHRAPRRGDRISADDPGLRPPSASTGLLEVFRRRYLLRLLVRREISARYQRSFLGMLWSYINPLSQFLIYYFVIGVILGLHRGIENFAIHIFAGLIIVHFFNETMNAGTRSIIANKSLVRKMALPREMFPVASMMVSAFHIGPQLVILGGACALAGWRPDAVGLAAAGMALLLTMLLGTGVALLFSAANVFLRDISSFVAIVSNTVRFGVPMIYPFSLVEERFGAAAEYYLWNPLADAVLLLQRGFWVGSTEDPAATTAEHIPSNLWTMAWLLTGVAVVLLAIAQLVFTRLENRIPERV